MYGHKWLNTPYDCGVAICRDAGAVNRVMTTRAPYLQAGTEPPPKDMVPESFRRARGVEVWAAIREMGSNRVGDLVERCCSYAQHLAQGLMEMGYELLNDVVLNQVVATIGGEDDMHRIVQRI
ncbi:hypothetical protein Misp06_01164 [Microbulbifer sp. NBRC 101763]